MVKEKSELYSYTIVQLSKRGVEMRDIADLVYLLQKDYIPDLSMDLCLKAVDAVLRKREVQNAVITGITLDVLAEEKKLDEPLQSILEKDEPLYGVDEVLTFSITNLYGSIGFTNYGYVDKLKPGILADLDDKATGKVNVFLDDLVGAIAAASAARIAHSIG